MIHFFFSFNMYAHTHIFSYVLTYTRRQLKLFCISYTHMTVYFYNHYIDWQHSGCCALNAILFI